MNLLGNLDHLIKGRGTTHLLIDLEYDSSKYNLVVASSYDENEKLKIGRFDF